MEWWQGLSIVIAGALAVVIVKGGDVLIAVMGARAGIKQNQQKTTVGELWVIIEDLRKAQNSLQEQNLGQGKEIAELHKLRADDQRARADDLQKAYAGHQRCLEENTQIHKNAAQLRVDMTQLRYTLQQMYNKNGTVPVHAVPGIIIADARGVVKIFSLSLTFWTHWLPADVEGQLIDLLIPERLRDQHRVGLTRLVQTGQGPPEDRIIDTWLLTKTGAEVPVSIKLSVLRTGQVGQNDWLIAALVQASASTSVPIVANASS